MAVALIAGGTASSKLHLPTPTTTYAATEGPAANFDAASTAISYTEVQVPMVEPQFVVLSAPISGSATHYGESYSGQTMACGGVYVSHDPTIVAVSLARDAEWDCGAYLEVCGALGCMKTVRQDSCPACQRNHLDLSEAGIALVCGADTDLCDVTIQPLRMVMMAPEGPSPPLEPLLNGY